MPIPIGFCYCYQLIFPLWNSYIRVLFFAQVTYSFPHAYGIPRTLYNKSLGQGHLCVDALLIFSHIIFEMTHTRNT